MGEKGGKRKPTGLDSPWPGEAKVNEKTEMDGGEMANVWRGGGGGGGGYQPRSPYRYVYFYLFIYVYILAHEKYTFCFSDLDRTTAEIL